MQAANVALTAPFTEESGSPDAPPADALAASEYPAAAAEAATGMSLVSDIQTMEVEMAKLRAELAACKVLEASRIDDPYAASITASSGPGPSGAGPAAATMAAAASPSAHRQASLQASAMMASIGEPSQAF